MKKDPKKPRNNFDIIPRIAPEIHSEYIAYHDTFDMNRVDWAKENRDKLLKKKTPLTEKKEILFALGHGKDLKALYGIQKYLKNPDPELEVWAFLSWQECQNNVLGTAMSGLFGNDPEPLIMTGLGGENKRLRFCFAICTKDDMKPKGKDAVSSVLEEVSKKYDSKTEEIFFGKNYTRITALIPMDVSPADFMEDTITRCNTKEEFLYPDYFTVNTHILSDDEIRGWIDEFE